MSSQPFTTCVGVTPVLPTDRKFCPSSGVVGSEMQGRRGGAERLTESARARPRGRPVPRSRRQEDVAEPSQRSVKGDLDGVRPDAEDLSDPARAEVCAVAEGEKLLLAFLELLDRRPDRKPPDRPLLEIVVNRDVRDVVAEQRALQHSYIGTSNSLRHTLLPRG
jgi:hypothetical protein